MGKVILFMGVDKPLEERKFPLSEELEYAVGTGS